jgi:hypothetical protein
MVTRKSGQSFLKSKKLILSHFNPENHYQYKKFKKTKKSLKNPKSNWVRFVFLDLNLFFKATLRLQITITKPLSSHETRGHKEEPFWW